MAAPSQDDFVDLYEILELPTDAESETIRQRLNTLYLEAQQNLDHRNPKKRLQYQQMYEVYLPQARHLLLDSKRRAEYDRYLAAYHTGHKVAPAAKSESEVSMPSISVVEEPPLPGMAEVDPAVLAAERENIWAKWKQGLELVDESEAESHTEPAPAAAEKITDSASSAAAAEAAAASTPAAPSVPPFARRRPAPPQRSGGGRPVLPPRGAGKAAPARPTAPSSRPPGLSRTPGIGTRGAISVDSEADAEAQREAERQQELEKQRYQITRDIVQNAGLLSGGAYAIGILVAGCVLLFLLMNYMKKIPLGLSSGTFAGLCLIVILAAAIFGGLTARRKAKQRTALELSLLPIEELLRRSRS
jgi:curved DNA-binding protein CbpA